MAPSLSRGGRYKPEIEHSVAVQYRSLWAKSDQSAVQQIDRYSISSLASPIICGGMLGPDVLAVLR
jgi:hypothetical protein